MFGVTVADVCIGKTTRTGRRRIRMDDKNWRSEWEANIFRLRYEDFKEDSRPLMLKY